MLDVDTRYNVYHVHWGDTQYTGGEFGVPWEYLGSTLGVLSTLQGYHDAGLSWVHRGLLCTFVETRVYCFEQCTLLNVPQCTPKCGGSLWIWFFPNAPQDSSGLPCRLTFVTKYEKKNYENNEVLQVPEGYVLTPSESPSVLMIVLFTSFVDEWITMKACKVLSLIESFSFNLKISISFL